MARWVQQAPATNPKWWSEACSAFDAGRNEVVVFGGAQSHGAFNVQNDTYVWGGSNWTLKAPTHKPPARVWASMAYLPGVGVILFGGEDAAGNPLGDTWLWDGSDWTQLAPAHSPSAREATMLAYHAPSAGLILFGGTTVGSLGTAGVKNDTWLYASADWTQLSPATTPTAGYGWLITQVASGNLRVGYQAAATVTAGQWEWDATDWTLVGTGPAAPKVGRPTGAYHANLGAGVMVVQTAPAEVTYVEDGAGSWTVLAPNPNVSNAVSAAGLPFSADKDGNALLLAYNGVNPTIDSTTTWILQRGGGRFAATIV